MVQRLHHEDHEGHEGSDKKIVIIALFVSFVVKNNFSKGV
jgi:hypothetical protein